MALTHWEPFRELQTIRDRLNHVFEDSILRPGSTLLSGLVDQPAMDVYTRDGVLTVEAHLPGFTADQIHVTLSNHTLTIKGERRQTEETTDKTYYRREISSGTIVRAITLPEEVDTASLEASFADGVLTLHAKQLAETPTTSIPIKPALKESAVG